MSGDIALEMPTDLRPAVSPFSVDSLSPAEAQERRKGITRLTVDIPSSYKPHLRSGKVSAPRWRTPEFFVYYCVFIIAIPLMIWIPVALSSPSHPNFPLYRRRLSPGWLFGRRVDASDSQYRGFRDNIFLLAAITIGSLLLKTIYLRATRRAASSQSQNPQQSIPFILLFSVIFLAGLHGASILKIFIILAVNFSIARMCGGSKIGPILTWAFNILVLFGNEWHDGYRFSTLHPFLGYLDTLNGVYPRWHVNFNITMLRLVSFNMDYYWACSRPEAPGPNTEAVLGEKERTTVSHPRNVYSFTNYVAYALYAPLYIAGPIMTFNDFMWQIRRPLRLPWRSTFNYALRFFACLLTMEFILHFMYVVAIKDTRAWAGDNAAQLSMIGFWNLIIVWLKLLVPWRFFRLWALLDGVDPPENMVRCMANNYSTLGFWRSWHRSYNLWIVRYIHIPLGGSKNVVFSTVLVFSFVALWHDLSFHLLAWGWLVSLFILPEIAARYILPASKYGERSWYRHACALGAVFNIATMMSANLVGFVLGTSGTSYMLQQLVGTSEGIRFSIIVCACLFVGVQVMFEYREEEMRKGVFRRC